MKKLITIFIAFILIFSICGCSSNKVDDSDKTLEIAYYDGGYGYSFIEKMGEVFEKNNPGVSVVLSKLSDMDPIELLSGGPKLNSADLFIHGTSFNDQAKRGDKALKGYDCILEPIDDVMDTEVDGKLIKDSFIDGFAPLKVNGHYYSFSWAIGMTGLVYNSTLFEQNGYKVPNTTNELLSLCEKIKSNGQVPFVFSSATGYWSYIRNIWYMQYQGVQGMYDLFAGIDDGMYSKECFLQEGRLVSLETLNQFININNGFNHKSVNYMTFTQSQAKLILGDGLMMVNGDWLENEMRKVGNQDENNYDFQMMNVPVVSKIIEKCATINDDATLSSVISFIDGKNDNKIGMENVSEEDILRINEARHCRNSIGFNHTVGIPVYATAKNLAKKFLTFMATKEAQNIYIDSTLGNRMPFQYNVEENDSIWNNMSEYSKSSYKLQKDAIYYGPNENGIYNLPVWNGERENPEIFFTAQNEKDRRTPKKLFDDDYAYWTIEKWNILLKSAGLI